MKVATKSDWLGLMEMGNDVVTLPLGIHFDKFQMHNLRLGFIPTDQNEKWFCYFADNILHIYRSWTGYKSYEVLFEDSQDGSVVVSAKLNLDPEYWSGTQKEAFEILGMLLSDFASDACHTPATENSFVATLHEATKPNYLGAPSVVLSLLSLFFHAVIAKDVAPYLSTEQKTTYQDVLTLNAQICAAICGGNPEYHGLESWRTEAGLGKAIVQSFGLNHDWFDGENLACIVSEGLTGVGLQINVILKTWLEDPNKHANFSDLLEFIKILQSFTASVLMGTNTVLFKNIELSDFTWANRSNFVNLGEVAACNDEKIRKSLLNEPLEPPCSQRYATQFEESVRELKKMDEESGPKIEDKDDHNPTDDEYWENEQLEPEPGPFIHPRIDDHGKAVKLTHPSIPTPLSTWHNPLAVATCIPEGMMPKQLNRIPFEPWRDHPVTIEGWEYTDCLNHEIEEPLLKKIPGMKLSAGGVVIEPDNRIWIIHPSNGFGGYKATFAKGTLDNRLSLQGTAVKEVYEESGLKIRITGWLGDFVRTTSICRLYLAERIGGTPADMGWGSQAVSLSPISELPNLLNGAADAPVIAELMKHYSVLQK